MDRVPVSATRYSEQADAEFFTQTHMDQTRDRNAIKVPKVHVNPNFRTNKSLVIHINPKIHKNRKIHLNPKMMNEMVTKTVSNGANGTSDDSRVRAEATPVNPEPVQRSIHVNPKLMKKLSTIVLNDIKAKSPKPLETDSDKAGSSAPSKKIESLSCNKALSKPLTPRLLAISRRKLVRIGSNNKPTSCVKRRSLQGAHARKSPAGLSKLVTNKTNKYKLDAYKIDRTIEERSRRKKTGFPDARIRNVNKGLVAIGGVMYQSSRTQLVRSATGTTVHKKKNCLLNAKGDTFVIAKNGKKLHRLRTSKEGTNLTRYMISRNSVNRNTVVKKVPNSIVHSSHKNVIR